MSIRNDVIDECIAVVKKTVRKNCDDHTPYYGECQNCGRYDNFDVPDYGGILDKLQHLKERSPRQENSNALNFTRLVEKILTDKQQLQTKIAALVSRLESHARNYECNYGDFDDIVSELRKLSVVQ
jgi:hypothetical protein